MIKNIYNRCRKPFCLFVCFCVWCVRLEICRKSGTLTTIRRILWKKDACCTRFWWFLKNITKIADIHVCIKVVAVSLQNWIAACKVIKKIKHNFLLSLMLVFTSFYQSKFHTEFRTKECKFYFLVKNLEQKY